jgi:hypothetical protein
VRARPRLAVPGGAPPRRSLVPAAPAQPRSPMAPARRAPSRPRALPCPASAPSRQWRPWRPAVVRGVLARPCSPAPACPARVVTAPTRPRARPSVPLARGLELGQRVALTCARLVRGACVRPCVRARVVRSALARLAVPSYAHGRARLPPYILCALITLFMLIK